MKYVVAALQYLPYVLGAVQGVETALAGATGATKKQAVLTAITAAGSVGEQVPEPHVALISKMIDTVVGMLNASGLFSHSTPAPAK